MMLYVHFGLAEPNFPLRQSDDELWEFYGNLIWEHEDETYKTHSYWGWVQNELTLFCRDWQITGLEFVKVPDDIHRPAVHLLCSEDLNRAAQALKQVADIMAEGKGLLNTYNAPHIEDREAFEKAQPLIKVVYWDTPSISSTFIKSLSVAINDAIRKQKCLFYFTYYL